MQPSCCKQKVPPHNPPAGVLSIPSLSAPVLEGRDPHSLAPASVLPTPLVFHPFAVLHPCFSHLVARLSLSSPPAAFIIPANHPSPFLRPLPFSPPLPHLHLPPPILTLHSSRHHGAPPLPHHLNSRRFMTCLLKGFSKHAQDSLLWPFPPPFALSVPPGPSSSCVRIAFLIL